MGQPVALDGVGQRLDHGVLADQFGKGLRPVLARKHAIGLRRGSRRNRRGSGLGCGRRFGISEQRGLSGCLQLGRAGRNFDLVVRLVAKDVGRNCPSGFD